MNTVSHLFIPHSQLSLFDTENFSEIQFHQDATFVYKQGGISIGVYVNFSPKRQRTVNFRVEKPYAVSVQAPIQATNNEIEAMLRARFEWLQSSWKKVASRTYRSKVTDFDYENTISFLGIDYILTVVERDEKIIPNDKAVTAIKGKRLVVSVKSGLTKEVRVRRIKQSLKEWLATKAAKILAKRTKDFAAKMNLYFSKVTIGDQKSRWGSCSPHIRSIRYNLRVAMLPISLLDYIVVHELAHLRQANHSKAFWAEVEKILPDYQRRRKWLRFEGKELEL
ncbi:MAG: SprT family zinc-dependent metalloprotease [Chloroherpetonaceae bacterium]|nr:SprT family zinc-dependent metalloprotease [Chloroherpetonaceae bacterium]